jgi:bacterioferritin-associated ferredoxin
MTSPGDLPDPDQELCVCFHVTRRKVENFIRLEQPRRAAQLAECYGAGTGCGWCRRYLIALFESWQKTGVPTADVPPPGQYRELRRQYHRETGWNSGES